MTVSIPQAWHTNQTARNDWPDAPLDDVQLATLLSVARNDVIAYAPKFTADDGTQSLGYVDQVTNTTVAVDDSTVPPDYRLAQLMQARNVWNSSKVDAGSGQMGDDTFVIRPFPLDWMIKQLIRPKRVLPWVG